MKLRSLLTPALLSGILFSAITAKSQTQKVPEYKLEKVVYNINNDKIRDILETEKSNTSFKKGEPLNKAVFEKERVRIESLVKAKVDRSFTKDQVNFRIDTTLSNHMYAVETVIVAD
jgi:hypothetical protein